MPVAVDGNRVAEKESVTVAVDQIRPNGQGVAASHKNFRDSRLGQCVADIMHQCTEIIQFYMIVFGIIFVQATNGFSCRQNIPSAVDQQCKQFLCLRATEHQRFAVHKQSNPPKVCTRTRLPMSFL